jgi:bifunctional DNase/RNase
VADVTDGVDVEMELVGVRVEMPSNTPVVVLRERSGMRRYLSIFIGAPEATAIAFAVEGVETPRPLTHDLMCATLDALGARIERVVVTELRDTTYFAELHIDQGGTAHVVSSRPSDAVALAARVGCPIYSANEVLVEAGYLDEVDDDENDEDEIVDPDEVVEEFRHFIDSVNPDDFGS